MDKIIIETDLTEEEKLIIDKGREEYKKGKFYNHDEIDWDNLNKLDL